MLYGLVADVHGNLEALKVVMEYLEQRHVDRYVFLGDAVGYGASPNEVCDILRTRMDIAVLGNHDAAVCGLMDYVDYYEAAREVLDWCGTQLSSENLNWLSQLPYKTQENQLGFCHGAPFAPEMFEYLFSEHPLEYFTAHADLLEPVTFIGHSHIPISFSFTDTTLERITDQQVIACVPPAKHIITVGAVGQPRDRNPQTCCGLYDTTTQNFTYVRLDYDIQTSRQKIIDTGLPAVFGDRLLVGV